MTQLVASLGTYDSVGVEASNDRLWTAIAVRLRRAGVEGVPDRLERSRSLEDIWDDPHLLLAQTCGYPMTTRWRNRLRYVATPRYRALGCEGASHRSRIIVRKGVDADTIEALRGSRVAVNDMASNTGMNLLRALIAPLAVGGSFFGRVSETGSHAESARAVANGDADLAAIDAVTFAHLEREQPEVTRRLRTLAWTTSSPGLPLVTSRATTADTIRHLRAAIAGAIAEEARADADHLLLDGIELLGTRRYDVVRTLERRAIRTGYARLA